MGELSSRYSTATYCEFLANSKQKNRVKRAFERAKKQTPFPGFWRRTNIESSTVDGIHHRTIS
jgi:hypothetical protein